MPIVIIVTLLVVAFLLDVDLFQRLEGHCNRNKILYKLYTARKIYQELTLVVALSTIFLNNYSTANIPNWMLLKVVTQQRGV